MAPPRRSWWIRHIVTDPMIVRGGGETRLRTLLVLNVSCNILDWKYIFFSMSFQVPFPRSFSQLSLSSFELGWPNPNNHLLAQCTFEDCLGKPTQSEHRAMMKVFLCYQPVPSPSCAVRQNILLDNSRTTWEHLPCPFLFGALLHNLTNTQDYCNNALLNWGLSSLPEALTSSNK